MLCWTEPLKRGPVLPNDEPKPHLLTCPAVAVGDNVYFFGGLYKANGQDPIDVHVFSTLSLCWSDLTPVTSGGGECPGEVPSMRHGHTAVLVEDAIYIQGGLVNFKLVEEERGILIKGGEYWDVTYAFNVDTHRWFKPKVSGDVPKGRWAHSACVLKKAMYVYGGFRVNGLTNDIYKLDTGTMFWSLISTRGSPVRVSGCHSTTIIGTKMFVFGGQGDVQDKDKYNHIRVFDTESNVWLSTPSAPPLPEQCEGHAAFAYNGELYIFGGYNFDRGHYMNDLWKLNTETFSWKKFHPKGKALVWRSSVCSCMVGDRVILLGGHRDATHTQLLLQILHLSPRLKMLCKLAVVQYDLELSELPHDIKWELEAMTTETANLNLLTDMENTKTLFV